MEQHHYLVRLFFWICPSLLLTIAASSTSRRRTHSSQKIVDATLAVCSLPHTWLLLCRIHQWASEFCSVCCCRSTCRSSFVPACTACKKTWLIRLHLPTRWDGSLGSPFLCCIARNVFCRIHSRLPCPPHFAVAVSNIDYSPCPCGNCGSAWARTLCICACRLVFSILRRTKLQSHCAHCSRCNSYGRCTPNTFFSLDFGPIL